MFSFLNREEENAIEVKELDGLLGKINLIDIRETHEFITGHIKGAKNIAMSELLNHPQQYLDKQKKYYLMCRSGARSSRTVMALRGMGYDVINVKGGISAYTGPNRE